MIFKMKLKEYLQKKFMDRFPATLDDEMADAYQDWLDGFTSEELLAIAEEWYNNK